MSIATRIETIEEHIGDIYDTLEIGGADLTNVNKNIVNINSQLKGRYLDYLNNGTDEIWNNWEKVTGTGTDVTLNNVVQAPMKIDVKGRSTQKTTQGNQLIDFANPSSSSAYVTTTFINDILTVTSTSGTYKRTSWDVKSIIINNSGKKLYFNYETINNQEQYGSIVQLNIFYNDGTSTLYKTMVNHNKYRYSYDIPNNTSNIGSAEITVYTNNTSTSQSASVIITKPMLQFGTEDKQYEEYTAGASPNPAYPQAINSVGDNVNLVDFNSGGGNTTKSFTSDTLTLTSSGTSRFWQYNITDLYKANAGKTLKFIYDSIDITDQHGTTVVQMRVTDTSEEITSTTMLTHSLTNTPYTIPADVSNISSAYLRIWTNSYSSTSYDAELEITKPKLQFGTENEAYSPYNMGVATIIKSNSDNTQSQTYSIYTQSPFRSIGEVRDDFVRQAGVLYERHNIGHILSYDGETITTAYMSTTGELSTGAEVIYVLEEPTLIQCTAEQVEQLEAISQAKSYANQTNIFSNDVIEPWLECVALKNI